MTGKERVRRAVEFGTPDRIPLDELDVFGSSGDKNWIVRKWRFDEAVRQWRRQDIWGCAHRSANRDLPGYHVENHPLDSWDKLETYVFPDPNTTIPHLEKTSRELDASPALRQRYHLLHIDPGPLLVIINLMEYENFLVQCMENPDRVGALYGRISEYKFQLVRLAHERVGPDGVVVFEDWGSQRGPLISPEMFRAILKPAVKIMADRVHSLGMHYGLQGSGDLGGILDEYMDAGLGFLWESQINSKKCDALRAKIRGRLCLMSCCDAQTTLPTGSPDDVRKEVLMLKECFATPEGGLVLMDIANPGAMPVPKENQFAQKKAMCGACGLECEAETASAASVP